MMSRIESMFVTTVITCIVFVMMIYACIIGTFVPRGSEYLMGAMFIVIATCLVGTALMLLIQQVLIRLDLMSLMIDDNQFDAHYATVTTVPKFQNID